VDNPEDASFQFGKYNDDNRMIFSGDTLTTDGDFNIRAASIYGSVAMETGGTIEWDGGKGVISATSLSHTEDANNYFTVEPDASRYVNLVIDSTPAINGLEITATGAGAVPLALSSDDVALTVSGKIVSSGGRIINTTRVATTYTVLTSDDSVFCDTDGGAFTATLPAGVDGQKFYITNCGSSNNNLTLSADGAELINGLGSQTLGDEDSIVIIYETTEGWRIF